MRISDWSSDVCSSDLFDIIPLEPRRETLAPLSEPKLFFRAGDLFIILHDPHRGTQEIIGTATSMRDAIRIAVPDDLTNDREVIIAPVHRIVVERKSTRQNSSH